jgi:hypothetical protein
VKRSAVINDEALHAMGRDIAAIHRATDTKGAVAADFGKRSTAWLHNAVKKAKAQVMKDWEDWAAYYGSLSEQPKKAKAAAKKGAKQH